MTKRKSKEQFTTSKSDTDGLSEAETLVVEESPSTEKPAEKSVGMTPYKWCGVDMFQCKKCGASTQDAGTAHSHVCKEIRTVESKGEDQ